MRRITPFLAVAAIALLIGFVGGWILANHVNETRLDRVVAMSWGDGNYGPAFYGAHVYLEALSNGYSVRARVYIGRGNNYFHDCGVLGTVQRDSEAVAKWGTIVWQQDGLHIGNGTNDYFLARARMENHR